LKIYSCKRGGIIVESAFIYPLTILVVVALITLIVELYDRVQSRVDHDLAIRRYAGSVSLTVASKASDPISFIGITEKGGSVLGYKTVTIDHAINGRQKGYFKWNSRLSETISYEIIDESRLIRNADIVSNGLKDLFID
jgi:hypothetical protein